MITRSDIDYDLTGLNDKLSALQGALFGQGGDGDLHRALKVEAGQLAWDISNALGPKDRESAAKSAESNVKTFLTTRPAYSNLTEEQQYSSTADFTWLEAGPNFLLGINDEDNQTQASAEDAMAFLRGSQAHGRSRGNAYVELGRHGKQHVLRLNRTRVSKSAFRSVVKAIGDKLGTLRASFAFTAARLVPSKRVPQWIARHFPSQANGRAIFNDSGLSHATQPYIEFGSTAKGVESQPKVREAIDGAIARRRHLIDAKLRKIQAGYTYDWNTGAVFKSREAQREDE